MNTLTSSADHVVRDGRDSRWAAHRAARRRDLLVSARRAIHRLGPEASMEEIAQHAGTSKSVFYRYFSDKNGLGQALGEFLLSQLEDRIQAAAAEGGDPRDVVHRMIDAYLAMVQRSPAIHEFVSSRSGLAWTRPEGPEHPTASLGLFADHVTGVLLEALRSTGPQGVGPSPVAPDAGAASWYWARGVVGMVHAVAEQWRRDRAEDSGPARVPDRPEVVAALTRWVLAPLPGDSFGRPLDRPPGGLGARAAPTPSPRTAVRQPNSRTPEAHQQKD